MHVAFFNPSKKVFASYVTEHNPLIHIAVGLCCAVYMSPQSLIPEY